MIVMDSDLRRLLVVVAVLAAVVAAVVVALRWRTVKAPRLVEVRVVTLAPGDKTATDRLRAVPAGTEVEAAAVIAYRRGDDGPVRWICGLPDVELDGRHVEVEPISSWPSSGGSLRGLWFKVEPSHLGGSAVTAAAAADVVAYKDFLALEMGRKVTATVSMEAHDDDFLGKPAPGNELGGGVIRLKVRVGAYKQESDVISSQSMSSPGEADVFGGKIPGIVVTLPFPAGVRPDVSRYLRLACFTFAPGVWPDGGPGWPFPLGPAKMVAGGYIVTPETLAAAAVGDPLGEPWRAPVRVVSDGTAWRAASGGKPLRWGGDVRVGDALRADGRYVVLLKDDGDGLLSLGDSVLFAWDEPAQVAPLGVALPANAERADLLAVRQAS